ncbi:MAG: ribose-phosphate diphosphokinase [Nanoarchaeota archaeon]|nr:ribose-phosphate diphosphokinase [Nanoarchaeota archaeon]
MLIIGCSNSRDLAKKIAVKARRHGKVKYSELETARFPDGEIYVRYNVPVKDKKVVLVQSFYGNISDEMIEVVFAAQTAKDLGAKEVTLVAPYFPYFRQDKRFKPGESISIQVIAKMLNRFIHRLIVVDPHLHRLKSMYDVFTCRCHNLSADPAIARYIEQNIKNVIIIGPDWESYRWAEKTADIIGCESAILEKKRYSATKVDVRINKKIDLKDKTVVLVDDIISTGHTMQEAIKDLKKIGAKKFVIICVHSLFVGNAMDRLKKTGARIVSCNTIKHKTNKIDVTSIIETALKHHIMETA